MNWEAELRQRRTGVHGGRVWHVEGQWTLRGPGRLGYMATLCGKVGNRDWHPGILNRNPSTCRVCMEKLAQERTAESGT